ncbi:hypothetical protein ACFS5L_14835 [Streptomyces phyllanthi]|uniref:DsbA family protein n=1 Tax=Streptomyces phyllanthi TaxID=1803180 RepID=UPI0018836953|nr:DsbA family protein [Streptomyces phyllanthi]
MPSAERASLTYAVDADCAWCYGSGPTARAFAEDNAHRIRLSVVPAGLCASARALPVAAYPHLSAERGRITQLTGAAFGGGYERAPARGTTVLDSAAAAAGPAALRDQPGVSEPDAAEAMQRAWFVDGRSLSDVDGYRDMAEEHGMDADAVTSTYNAPAGREGPRRLPRAAPPGLHLLPGAAAHRTRCRPDGWRGLNSRLPDRRPRPTPGCGHPSGTSIHNQSL